MRKILIFFLVITSLSVSTNAQTCVIKGTDDGSSVEIQSCYLEGNKVIVNVSNDSKDIAANVTVEVNVTYKCGSATNSKAYSGKALSIAGISTEIKIPVDLENGSSCYKAYSVVTTAISGTKCTTVQ